MPTGPKGQRRPADVIGNAIRVAQIATGEAEEEYEIGPKKSTRLTNAFSKKLENHYRALSLYFVFYNFVRIHKTLKVTPAMQAGITDRLWSMEDIVGLVDDLEVARLTGKRAAQLASA